MSGTTGEGRRRLFACDEEVDGCALDVFVEAALDDGVDGGVCDADGCDVETGKDDGLHWILDNVIN